MDINFTLMNKGNGKTKDNGDQIFLKMKTKCTSICYDFTYYIHGIFLPFNPILKSDCVCWYTFILFITPL